MEVKTSLKYLRMAPRKVRMVVDLVRGMSVESAERYLAFSERKAAKPILKLLKSVIANAKNNFNFDEKKIKTLYIKKIFVDEGPKLKRWRPVSRGSAHPIQKKTSHVNIILEEKLSKARVNSKKIKKI